MQINIFGEPLKGQTMAKEYQDITSAFSHNDQFSYDANKSMKQNKSKLRARILVYIAGRRDLGGATCDEVEQALELSHQSASARMTELKAKGLIKLAGKRKTRSGRNAGVWTI